MIPLSLKLSNFTSYGESVPELDFTKFHMSAISGPNGAGKSSLLDAITWCVWGSSRAGDSSNDLVRLGAQEMFVEFSFELDGQKFTVKRRRSLKHGGSSALEFWSNSHNLTEGTIKTTQQKIINSLHLTYETFTNSSFLRQGHADEFTTKGPTDRKRILADILGLSHYDLLEEKAKEKVKKIQIDLSRLDYQILEIEAELSQKEESEQKKTQAEEKVNKLESEINILEKEIKILQEKKTTLAATSEQHNKLIQTLTGLKNELYNILTQGKSRAEKIKQLEIDLIELPTFEEGLKEIKILEKEKENYQKSSQEKLILEKELSEISSKLSLKMAKKESLQEKLNEIKSHIKTLGEKTAKCPTCGQVIESDQKGKIEKEYLSNQKKINLEINEIKTDIEEKKIQQLEKQISQIKLDDIQHQKILLKLSELTNLQEKREQLIAAQATLASEKKVVLELRAIFINKKSQIEKLEQDVNKLPNLSSDLQKLTDQINQKELYLTSLKTEEKEVRNILGQANQLITRAEQLEKTLKQKQQEKDGLNKEKQGYEELALAFGKKGIQAMIIETAIPEIEEEANSLLDKLTEGRMKVRFETLRETKTKLAGERGIVETLDIIISDEMGERNYEMYSGGEAFRVNFAIRIALSKLLTRRAGAKLQFLVIDEGFGTQDAAGRSRIVEVLDAIKNDFEKIVVITHLEELKEEFPTRIEVSKNNIGSIFEVIGV